MKFCEDLKIKDSVVLIVIGLFRFSTSSVRSGKLCWSRDVSVLSDFSYLRHEAHTSFLPF